MDLGIEGRVAMVAAASQGIGLAIATALAKEGVRVSLCGTNPERVKAAVAGLSPDSTRHWGQVCNLLSEAALEDWHQKTVEHLGAPSILITNIGGPPAGPATEFQRHNWEIGFSAVYLSTLKLVDLVMPAMKAAKWGRIVHVSSSVAKDPNPILAISSSLRAGLASLARLQAKELGPYGITVNGLLPGQTATERQVQLIRAKAERSQRSFEEEQARIIAEIPLQRLARPQEIADVAAFLCSERASFVSGCQMVVDGAVTKGNG
jgi:3-oxoacyl-[acyl-carrier protein] reductase